MSARKVPLEIEAKLLVPAAVELRSIAALRRIGPYRVLSRQTARLHSEYLDTPELTLARHGIALRLRRKGRRWEATLKWEGKTGRLIHERPEINVPLPGQPSIPFSLPDGPIRRRLARLVAGKPLRPILRTLIHRRTFYLLATEQAGGAEPVAELALDTVRLLAPSRRGRRVIHGTPGPRIAYREVEIELLGGTRRDLVRIAKALQQDFGLAPSRQSKFARGLALLYPEFTRARKRHERGMRRSPVSLP